MAPRRQLHAASGGAIGSARGRREFVGNPRGVPYGKPQENGGLMEFNGISMGIYPLVK